MRMDILLPMRVLSRGARQAAWTFMVQLPVIVSNGIRRDHPLGYIDYIGWGIWAVGLLIESVAGEMLLKFCCRIAIALTTAAQTIKRKCSTAPWCGRTSGSNMGCGGTRDTRTTLVKYSAGQVSIYPRTWYLAGGGQL